MSLSVESDTGELVGIRLSRHPARPARKHRRAGTAHGYHPAARGPAEDDQLRFFLAGGERHSPPASNLYNELSPDESSPRCSCRDDYGAAVSGERLRPRHLRETSCASFPRGSRCPVPFRDGHRNGPRPAAAAERLQALMKEHPKNPWFPTLSRQEQGAEPGSRRGEQGSGAVPPGSRSGRRGGTAEAEFMARRGLCRLLRDQGRLEKAEDELQTGGPKWQSPPACRSCGCAPTSSGPCTGSPGESSSRPTGPCAGIQDGVERRGPLPPPARAPLRAGQGRPADRPVPGSTPSAIGVLAERAAAVGRRPWEAQARYGMAAVRMLESTRCRATPAARRCWSWRTAPWRGPRRGKPRLEAQSLWMLGSLDDAAEAQGSPGALLRGGRHASGSGASAERAGAAPGRHRSRGGGGGHPRGPGAGAGVRRCPGADVVLERAHAGELGPGPAEKALADAWAALDAIEALRDQQGDRRASPASSPPGPRTTTGSRAGCSRPGDPERAFGVIERMRSRTLIDCPRPLPPRARGLPAPLGPARRLFLEIAQVQRRLLDPALAAGKRAKAQSRARPPGGRGGGPPRPHRRGRTRPMPP